jgi:hypothetical protein
MVGDKSEAAMTRTEHAGNPDHADVIDRELEVLIDQLIPPEPSRRRMRAGGFAVLIAGIGLAVAWATGFLVPNPTHMTSSSSSTTMVAVDAETHRIAIAGLWFRNTSLATLELDAVNLDAPGLELQSVTQDDGEGTVADIRDYLLRPEAAQSLPVTLAPGQDVRVVAYATVTDCVDPDRAWGRVTGRWRYPDRPSWWARWESADQLLWQPAGDETSWQEDQGDRGSLQTTAVNLAGDMIDITGPLSGACELVGVER